MSANPRIFYLLKPSGDSIATFLAHAGLGRRIIRLKAKGVFFSQGNSADSVFYLQKGRAKVTVVSEAGMVYAIGPACGCKVRWLSHLS